MAKTKTITTIKTKNGKTTKKITMLADADLSKMTKDDLKNMLYDACENYFETCKNLKDDNTTKGFKQNLKNMLDFTSYVKTLFEDYEYYTLNKNNKDFTLKVRPNKKK